MDKDNSRIENLLAMILLNSLKGASTLAEKANQLNLAGFSNVEISNFLETKPNIIAQVLYEKRKKKTSKK